MKIYFERGFAHARWSDEQLLYLMDRPEIPEKAKVLFAHILASTQVWAGRMVGPLASLPIWPSVEDFDFSAALEAAYGRMRQVVDAFSADYNTVIAYTNSAGLEFENSVQDILQHVLLHGHYHRGQINHLMKEAGIAPVGIDFITFARL